MKALDAILLSKLVSQSSIVGLRGVDHPEAVLIHSQVNVRFPSPAVGAGTRLSSASAEARAPREWIVVSLGKTRVKRHVAGGALLRA
ncbi:hypothetical protein EYF80_019404 [Liparis tanakae]|uniref:Uncharacterized protein n=1 Tax=Liparis tanakae TaxID=230148 RepID=A0A4Z2HXI8_9TELE|nr:hypothetical protein EYF80_019404 [Liparis tanakae]